MLQINFFSPGLFEKISPFYFFSLLMIYLDVSSYTENHSLETWKDATHLCLSYHCISYHFFPSFTNNFCNLVLFFCYSCLNFIVITFYLFIYMCAHASQNTCGNQTQCEGIASSTPGVRWCHQAWGTHLCPLRTFFLMFFRTFFKKKRRKNFSALQKN